MQKIEIITLRKEIAAKDIEEDEETLNYYCSTAVL